MDSRRTDSRSGSALLIVLAAVSILALLIAGFGRELRTELRAADGFFADAQNRQLALSALSAAKVELLKTNAHLYANSTGDVYFVASDESYETEIETLSIYRAGVQLGRGWLRYRFIRKPNELDINGLNSAQWHRLFEVACGMDEGAERSAAVDSILDWLDTDSSAREYGAEEEFYQSLELPRHCRNGEFVMMEELLLVNGVTPDMFHGFGAPLLVENGLLTGGGLRRRLVGDNSVEGRATATYIRNGTMPLDNSRASIETENEDEFTRLTTFPETLWLIAEGFFIDESIITSAGEETPPPVVASYLIIAKLKLPDGRDRAASYAIEELNLNAAGDAAEMILKYGIPEDNYEF